jgi:asparagine synthase (glutamine-hydrolysing)
MSAIVGIYYPDGRTVKSEQLTKMTDILAHRGSDNVGIWCEDNVGLGHRMLYTTPESLHEQLPFVDSSGDYVITADARIDNREELLALLDFGDIPPEKIADSQIILAAYKKWGDQCPDKLLGDFAFVIWDKPQEQLFCGRDHFGVKPFYYYYSPEIFTFATEVKAIFTESAIPREINEVRIGDYLASIFHDKEITSYINVLRLPPASWMKINVKGKEIQTYWNLDPNRKIIMDSDEEYAAKFKEIFTEAVRCRLRSAFSMGVALSGGLDSSSITCVARNLLRKQQAPLLHTFSGVFDELKKCDEREYINPIIEQGELKPHFVNSDRINPFDEIDRVMWYQDEAFYAPHWFMSWKIYGEVKKQGVRVVLDGFDGDTTVSHGYGYLNELAEAGKWLKFARQTKAYTDNQDASFLRLFWRYFRYYGVKRVFDIDKYSLSNITNHIAKVFPSLPKLQKSYFSKPDKISKSGDIIDRAFAERIKLLERVRACNQVRPFMGQNEKIRHYRNILSGLCTFTLEVADKFASPYQLELRYPFWDKRLVEFCLALPTEQKLNLGWDRIVMRRAMKNVLPEKVRWRKKKTDFFPSVIRGLTYLKQKEWNDFLVNTQEESQKYVKTILVQEIYRKFTSANCTISRREYQTLWFVFSILLWLSFVNKHNVAKCKKLSEVK